MGNEAEELFLKRARQDLEGKRIVHVRYMTKKEAAVLDWPHRGILLVLDDGTFIFPSKDDEGNDAGALFGSTPQQKFTIPVM